MQTAASFYQQRIWRNYLFKKETRMPIIYVLVVVAYILSIDPFFQFIKRKIQPTKISQSSHQISAFVDDVSIFFQNLTDIGKHENCKEKFKKATNLKVNRTKSNLFKLGAWKNETHWQITWIKSQEPIKMLGILWYENIPLQIITITRVHNSPFINCQRNF